MAKIALLIGVSQYDSADFNPLPAAQRDIVAVKSVLQDSNLGNFDSVKDLLDPDLGQLQDAINTLFDECQSDDLVLLYFSGHGITDESGTFFFTNRTTRKTKQGRLNKGTATPASFVHDLMEYCESDRQVIVLDCCHSGAFPTGMMARDAGTIDFQRQLGGKGRIILTSSAATEYSFERQGEDLAVYTRYWVEGIQTGAADLDGDGAISVNELHDYVREQVRKAAPAMKPERYVFQEGEKILLARAPIGDPKQEFRKLVQTYSQDGLIRPAGQSMLERRRKALKLAPEVAQAIIAEVLRPYEEHRENLQEYERVLQAELAFESPLSDRALQELQALQRELNLTDDNIATLLQRLSPPLLPFSSPPLLPFFTADLGNSITLDMIAIPAGTFWMGQTEAEKQTLIQEAGEENYKKYFARELPRHQVTIASFYLGKFPVTQSQWQAIAKLPKINLDLNPDPAHFKGEQLPVEKVSWDEAMEFCARLSHKAGKLYRLPSEAEWEYACRAGSTTPFCFGDTLSTDQANYDGKYTYGAGKKGKYRGQTTSMGTFPPNAFGLYDMHGNVWEWCADPWHDSYDRAPTDGSIWELESDRDNTLRLLRGGSWDYVPRYCRSASRYRGGRYFRDDDFGFRVVCVVPGTL